MATDSSVPPLTDTATLTISITQAAANNALLDGTYVFNAEGYDIASGGAAIYAGIFTADGNGNITAGTLDLNSPSTSGSDVGFTGTYSLNSDNRGTMTLNTASLGTLSIAMAASNISSNVAGSGTIVEFDNPAIGFVASGAFEAQTPGPYGNSSFSGGYAFGITGTVPGTARYSAAGAFTSAGNGTINSGKQDVDAGGSVTADQTITSGTYSVAANGRATLTLTNSLGSSDYVFYLSSSGSGVMMSTDPGSSSPLAGGLVTAQTGGPYSNASLNATSVISWSTGVASVSGADAVLGLLTGDGNGNFSLTADENDAGNIIPNSGSSGTYTVSANGRATFSDLPNSPVLYFTGANQGYLVGTDAGAESGSILAQANASYSNASLSGAYSGSSTLPQYAGAVLLSGVATADGVSILGFTDDTNFSGITSYGNATTFTYSIDPTGRGTTVSGQQGSVFYMISPSEFVVLSVYPLNTNAIIGLFNLQ